MPGVFWRAPAVWFFFCASFVVSTVCPHLTLSATKRRQQRWVGGRGRGRRGGGRRRMNPSTWPTTIYTAAWLCNDQSHSKFIHGLSFWRSAPQPGGFFSLRMNRSLTQSVYNTLFSFLFSIHIFFPHLLVVFKFSYFVIVVFDRTDRTVRTAGQTRQTGTQRWPRRYGAAGKLDTWKPCNLKYRGGSQIRKKGEFREISPP